MQTTKRRGPLIIFLAAVIASAIVSLSCSKPALQPNPPRANSPPPAALREGKPPIIFIPGILGSRLVNRVTGEPVWPDMKGDDIALPISSPSLAGNRDDLAPSGVLEEVRIIPFLPKVAIYGPLFKNLEVYGGYRRSDLNAPPPWGAANTFYVFAYDWRRDLVESARALGCAIDDLKRRMGRPDLRFDIVAHSMGGLVARYYAMYGGRDVLDDPCPRPDWSGARNLGRIVMIGAPNSGSMNALRVLLRGYSATDTPRRSGGILRKVKRGLDGARVGPGEIFTIPSIYQLLPGSQQARFFDEDLTPLPVEIYNVETWRYYGWSAAFDAEVRQREWNQLVKDLGPAAGRAESLRRHGERERFLRLALWRAAAFHNALAAPSPPPANLRFIFIGGDCIGTLDGAVILRDGLNGGPPRTIFRPSNFSSQTGLRRKVADLIFSPGDGIVTRHSFLSHSLNSRSAAPASLPSTPGGTVFFCESHNGLILDGEARNYLLIALLPRQ